MSKCSDNFMSGVKKKTADIDNTSYRFLSIIICMYIIYLDNALQRPNLGPRPVAGYHPRHCSRSKPLAWTEMTLERGTVEVGTFADFTDRPSCRAADLEESIARCAEST